MLCLVQQALSLHSGVFDPLLDMLKCDDPLRQEAAADMLATLTSDNLEFTVKVSRNYEVVDATLKCLSILEEVDAVSFACMLAWGWNRAWVLVSC